MILLFNFPESKLVGNAIHSAHISQDGVCSLQCSCGLALAFRNPVKSTRFACVGMLSLEISRLCWQSCFQPTGGARHTESDLSPMWQCSKINNAWMLQNAQGAQPLWPNVSEYKTLIQVLKGTCCCGSVTSYRHKFCSTPDTC